MSSDPHPMADDPRRQSILEAAFQTFAQYGYRRTSMEDIARAAGLSRPALYQHFRNKEDIARSLTQGYFDAAISALRSELAQPGPPEARLAAAFGAMSGQIKEALLNAPHGMEMLEMGRSVASAEIADGMARKTVVLRDWLLREAAAGRIRLEEDAEVMAQAMLAALDGLKAPPFAAYQARVAALAALFGRGLTAKSVNR